MNRDLCDVDVLERDVLALTFDLVVSLEIIEGLFRNVCSDGSSVLLGDRRNENRFTKEELEIDTVCSGVLGKCVPERVQNWCTVEVCLVEGSKEVIEESVSERERQGISNAHVE